MRESRPLSWPSPAGLVPGALGRTGTLYVAAPSLSGISLFISGYWGNSAWPSECPLGLWQFEKWSHRHRNTKSLHSGRDDGDQGSGVTGRLEAASFHNAHSARVFNPILGSNFAAKNGHGRLWKHDLLRA